MGSVPSRDNEISKARAWGSASLAGVAGIANQGDKENEMTFTFILAVALANAWLHRRR